MRLLRSASRAAQPGARAIDVRRLRTSILQFVLALLLSLALWTFVSFSGNPTTQTSLEIPVAVSEPPGNLMIVNPATGEPLELRRQVELEVSGPQVDLDRLTPSNFRATVDLRGLNEGIHSVPIIIRGPRGVQWGASNPSTLEIALAPKTSRTMSVRSDIQGQLPFGFEQKSISVAARQVVITGPRDLVERVERVIVPIDIQGRTTTLSGQIELLPLDENGDVINGVTLTPEATRVNVRIEPRVDIQQISVLPRFVGQPAPGYTTELIDWNPKFVGVIAPIAITGTLETEQIDLTGRTEAFTQTVRVINPEPGVTQLLSDTIAVRVPIVPFQLPQNYPLIVPVTPENLAQGLEVKAEPASVAITVSGTFDQLRQVAETRLQAVVDLSGLGPGSYTLPVAISLPPGLQIVGELPQVTIQINEPPTATPPP